MSIAFHLQTRRTYKLRTPERIVPLVGHRGGVSSFPGEQGQLLLRQIALKQSSEAASPIAILAGAFGFQGLPGWGLTRRWDLFLDSP